MTIHYDHGFSLTTEPQDGAFPKTLSQFPYEKLKTSSDDGIRMLYLDFGGKEGEIVSSFSYSSACGIASEKWKIFLGTGLR